jgi:hypothetical protein
MCRRRSETDADSVFSETTSNASAFSQPAGFLHQPRPQRIHSFDLHQELSNPSSSISSLSPASVTLRRSRSPLAGARSAGGSSFALPSTGSRVQLEPRSESAAVVSTSLHRRKREDRGTLQSARYDTPLRRYIRTMTRMGLGDIAMAMAVGMLLLLKWIVGFGGYSGE